MKYRHNHHIHQHKSWSESLIILFIQIILRFVVFPLVRLIWIKRVIGLNNLPQEGAAIIAFNHQSYFDFIGFMAIVPRPIYYLAAEKFYTRETSFFWGPVLKATRQIKVDRYAKDKANVYDSVYSALNQGFLIGIFPEGTRAPDDTKMLHAYPGVARFATTAHVPVIPVGIKGAYEIMSRHDSRPSLKKKLEFIIGKPIDIEIPNLNSETLQAKTDMIMLAISELSDKSYPYA